MTMIGEGGFQKSGAMMAGRFSLVELLVVMAIIALLVSLLFPVLRQAKDKSLEMACGNNLKQIGNGAAMYIGDYDYYPKNGAMPGNLPFWQHQLGNYLSYPTFDSAAYVQILDVNRDYSILRCPADKDPISPGTVIGGKRGISYGMNGQIGMAILVDPVNYLYYGAKANMVKRPARTYFLMDANALNVYWGSPHANLGFFHGGGDYLNMLFSDFHVGRGGYPMTGEVPGVDLSEWLRN